MNERELFLEIGRIDEDLIEEAGRMFPDSWKTMGSWKKHGFLHRSKKGLVAAAAVLIVILSAVTWSGGFTAMAARISNYISGIIKTPDDMLDLGSAGSLNIGRVDGLDDELCKRYTTFEAMEDDLGLDLLEYSGSYELSLGGNDRSILLQYFDYNESASISVPVTITDSDGTPFSFSYEMNFLTGDDGRLGSYGFVSDGQEASFELESYTHPYLDIPVALIRFSNGGAAACFIYEDVRYFITWVRDEETLKEIVENLR